jgi:YHS domain-containing protein
MAKDPICGMDVSPDTNLKLTVAGETFYFCNAGCLKKFALGRGISQQAVDNILAGPRRGAGCGQV